MDAEGLLSEFIEGWAYTRAGVVEEVENIPADSWSYRITDENRSVAELVRHIVESGEMMVGELTRPDGDFTRQGYPEFIAEYAGHVADVTGKEALLEMLRRTGAGGRERLAAAGDLLFSEIKQFNGQPATRLAWLHHGIAHEEYHRGQLTLYARRLGLVPALTQKIRE